MPPLTGTSALFPMPRLLFGRGLAAGRIAGLRAGRCPGCSRGGWDVPRVAGTSQGKDIRGQVRGVLHPTPQGSGVLQS